MPTRKANATWEGGLRGGKGSFKGEAGIGGAYNFTSRFEEGMTGSNPEELLAAAHAACYSMALAGDLERNGTPPESVQTEGACTIEKLEKGWTVTRMKLTSRAKVQGIDPAKFQEIAQGTKLGCPISRALGAIEIELDAQLT
jgi:osmotically inducible protein OsmC